MTAQPYSLSDTSALTPDPESRRAVEGKNLYLESLSLVERLHRRFLDVVKAELERLGLEDVNNVQSLILYNIGEEVLTVGELTNRGYYLGSNVSYNVKKLVENGYLEQQRSPHDRRSVRVRLSQKGLTLHDKVDALYDRHVEALFGGAMSDEELAVMNASLRVLEHFWSDRLRFGS